MQEFERFIQAAKTGDLEVTRTVVENHPDFINAKDETGATALHYAALSGHRELVQLLVKLGADINARDDQFGATPAGWAIEYLRELGGFLGIELRDFAYAIEGGDVDWVHRFLERFPALARMNAPDGRSFKSLAKESGRPEIEKLFE
jgi:hypothetical protein